MARYKYQSHLRDGNGKVISGGTVSVYNAGTPDAATIYEASAGGASVSSVTTDSTGYFYFWLDDGDYTTGDRIKLICTKTGFLGQTYDEIWVF